MEDSTNDLLARILAVVLSGIAMLWGSWNTQDRFTGSEGKVLEERVRQLEKRVDLLPPAYLLQEIQEINKRLDRLEGKPKHIKVKDAQAQEG